MAESNVFFKFGALSDDFSTQLEQQGYELKNKEKWDKAVFSVVYLHIHDILTDSRYDECLKRIIKKSKVDWLKSKEEIFRHIQKLCWMDDAIKHCKDLGYDNLNSDDFENIADTFLKNYDCNVSENAQFEKIIENYVTETNC